MTPQIPPRTCAAILAFAFLLTPVWSWAAITQAEYSGGTLTITTPDSHVSCKPTDTVDVVGVTAGHPITITFFRWDETLNWVFTLGSVTVSSDGSYPFPYPAITGTMWFFISINDDTPDVPVKVRFGKWSITCEPTTGGEGCTPGYWRNHFEDWPPTGYAPTDIFNAVFGVSYFSSAYTLGQAIWQGGGGVNRLARHGTAALLSAAHPAVDYPYTVAQVIAMVQSGTIDPLAQANELGCSIPN